MLYIACQEGKTDVVEYFLSKKMNALIKSKSDDNEWESCLQVAARWNYITIVNLLLERGNFKNIDIIEVLKLRYLKKPMINLLKIHNDRIVKKKGCHCF